MNNRFLKRDGGDPYLLSKDDNLSIPPVPSTSLRQYAKPFIRCLNSPIILFKDVQFRNNTLEFSSGRLPWYFFRQGVPPVDYTVTLDKDGNAKAYLKHPDRELPAGEHLQHTDNRR